MSEQKKILKAATIYSPPMVSKCVDDLDNCPNPGDEILFLQLIADLINYQLQVTIVPDNEVMVSMAVNHSVDITAYSLPANILFQYGCEKFFFEGFDEYVFLMKGSPSSKFVEGMVLQAFQWNVWLLLLMFAGLVWLIDEAKVALCGVVDRRDVGAAVVWIMFALCLNCYGSLVSISAYNANDNPLLVPLKTTDELVQAIIDGSCHFIYNDEYGEDFFLEVFSTAIKPDMLQQLKQAMNRQPAELSENRVKIRIRLESTDSCLVAIDYYSMVPYFRILQGSSPVQVVQFEEIISQPYFYCISSTHPELNTLVALAQSSIIWAVAERQSKVFAEQFVDEGEENVTQISVNLLQADNGKSDFNNAPTEQQMIITVLQISDCLQLIWISYMLSFVVLIFERFSFRPQHRF
ncbi:conserved hypothetical protein [Trichinella spiralis]|uniref:Ionotropic glutamate receptor C-terminal domain-containing protein n=1 Tax=Trichinella spiralis TaxID=6334 RepID=E5SDW3_TRISP|nr:conserved hypothetical protein [Trichinella spiralis]KRY31152.1 hypothetical protein T01_11016 [Trichinella spiralis]